MATCRDVDTDALVLLGLVGIGETPEGPHLTATQAGLQAMLEQWAFGGLLGALKDVLVSADYEAGENERVTSTETVTVTLPATVPDPESDSGYRAPREGALVEIALGDPYEIWRYDTRAGAWRKLTELTLTDTCPLSDIGRTGLASALAVHVAPMLGVEANAGVMRAAAMFRLSVASRLTRRDVEFF